MKCKTSHNGVWAYLEATGVLNGTPEQIAAARRAYRREYKAQWKKQKRKTDKEIETYWNEDELSLLLKSAKSHNTTPTQFVKLSAIAYMHKAYIVPDQAHVRLIAQYIAMTYNSLQELIDKVELPPHTAQTLTQHIIDLEHIILSTLHNPQLLTDHIRDILTQHPEKKGAMLDFIIAMK